MSLLPSSSTRYSPQNESQHSQRLKIGLMTDAFLPLSNGVTHSVAALARFLKQNGHEPHIFTFAPTSELRVVPEGLLDDPPHLFRVPPREGEEAIEGVPIHYATALPIMETGYFFGVRYPMWMRSLLEEMDILHVHHPFISGRIARRLRTDAQPIVFTNHTRYDIYTHYFQSAVPRQMQSLTQPHTTPETLGRRFAWRAARFANSCDAVIAPSASMREVLADWGVRAPVHVIPNGIDLSCFIALAATDNAATDNAATDNAATDNAATHNAISSTRNQENMLHEANVKSRAAWRRRWEIAPEAPLAIYLGRVAPEKNGRVLLEAFALALQKNSALRLVIVGNGPSFEDWIGWTREFGAHDAVHFAGALSPNDVLSALAAADLFVSSSVSEVHPLTFIEAMASGLPCLGTPSPGVRDSIADGRNGWIAPPESSVFAEVLSRALGDVAECKRRGARAREDSRAYSMEANATRVMDLYREVLQVRREDADAKTRIRHAVS